MHVAEKAERSLLARVISLEGAMAAFGLYSLGSGLWQREPLSAFWGVTILLGLAVLTAVRRRDWRQHWELLERQDASTPPQATAPSEDCNARTDVKDP
jgi:type VI protein secretion system component VasK